MDGGTGAHITRDWLLVIRATVVDRLDTGLHQLAVC